MMTIFGVSWADLELSHVEAFFREAGDEGLTWEAKGTERPRRDSVLKTCSGFANSIGGYYVLGASRLADRWAVDGIDFNGEEPRLWLGNVIHSGVNPVPRYDIHAWEVPGARHVTVVRIDPVALPPCMTASGEVFERVSGATRRVDDPATLRRLFDRGETALATAEEVAMRALGEPLTSEGSLLHVVLVVAPTGKPEDVAARLFAATFEERLVASFDGLPRSPLFDMPHAHQLRDRHVSQGAVSFVGTEGIERWGVTVGWDASVKVTLTVMPDDDDPQLYADLVFDDAVRPAATAATTMAHDLGGYGRAYVALRVAGIRFRLRYDGRDKGLRMTGVTSRAWTADDGLVTDSAIQRMKRETLRGFGFPVYEPES